MRVGAGVTSSSFIRTLDSVVDWENTSLEELHASFQQLVKHFDTTDDGHISRDEASKMLEQFPFLRIEISVASRSTDGTGSNLANGRPGRVFGLRSITREPTDDDVTRILQLNDTNQDGKLGAGDQIAPNWSRNFARNDANQDGYLDLTEIKNARIIPFSGKLFLEAYDTDGDGVLTKREARHPALRSFEQRDTDNSGTLNEQELDAVRGNISSGSGASWSSSR